MGILCEKEKKVKKLKTIRDIYTLKYSNDHRYYLNIANNDVINIVRDSGNRTVASIYTDYSPLAWKEIIETLRMFGFDVEYSPIPYLGETAGRLLNHYLNRGYAKVVKKGNQIKVFNRFQHIDNPDATESEYVVFGLTASIFDFVHLEDGEIYILEDLVI